MTEILHWSLLFLEREFVGGVVGGHKKNPGEFFLGILILVRLGLECVEIEF